VLSEIGMEEVARTDVVVQAQRRDGSGAVYLVVEGLLGCRA
jgi:hypothetical protein